MQGLTAGTGLPQSQGVNAAQGLPGGFLLQAGTGSTGSGGLATVQFPLAFPNRGVAMLAGEANAMATWGIGRPTLYGVYDEKIGPSAATICGTQFSGAGGSWGLLPGISFFWIALGY